MAAVMSKASSIGIYSSYPLWRGRKCPKSKRTKHKSITSANHIPPRESSADLRSALLCMTHLKAVPGCPGIICDANRKADAFLLRTGMTNQANDRLLESRIRRIEGEEVRALDLDEGYQRILDDVAKRREGKDELEGVVGRGGSPSLQFAAREDRAPPLPPLLPQEWHTERLGDVEVFPGVQVQILPAPDDFLSKRVCTCIALFGGFLWFLYCVFSS
ncbi:hypothetical protein BDZ45DRAFT_448152 [Acephala macrosclerotiorum]|nr:hypothetical protein BDZ45DRAFT_448152 [Acephala macrosclerotiorum]